MKKKLFLFGGGSALLLLAILFGAFFAGPLVASAYSTQNQNTTTTPTTGTYCQQYLQDLAQRLKVSVSTLEQDSLAAKEDILAQLVKDGKLTQAQADAIKQRLEAKTTCGLPGTAKVKRGILRQTLQKYQSTLLNQIASGLHLSSSQLQSDLKNGQTLSQIATAQKVAQSQLHTTVLSAIQNTLSQAEQAGDITPSQETAFTQFLQKHPGVINRWLHRSFAKK